MSTPSKPTSPTNAVGSGETALDRVRALIAKAEVTHPTKDQARAAVTPAPARPAPVRPAPVRPAPVAAETPAVAAVAEPATEPEPEPEPENTYGELIEALREAVTRAVTETVESFIRAGVPAPPARPKIAGHGAHAVRAEGAASAAPAVDWNGIARNPDGTHEPTACIGGCGAVLTKGFRCKECRKARREARQAVAS